MAAIAEKKGKCIIDLEVLWFYFLPFREQINSVVIIITTEYDYTTIALCAPDEACVSVLR